MQNIAVTDFNKLRSTFISESTQYSGASKMGEVSALKGVEGKPDFYSHIIGLTRANTTLPNPPKTDNLLII